MDTQQRIAALKSALAALDSAIAQTEATLRIATDPVDIAGLTSALVDLRSERARAQFELDSLEAAIVVVSPLAAPTARRRALGAPARGTRSKASKARMAALHKEIARVGTGREVVRSTINFATDVAKMAKTLRLAGDNPHVPKRPKKPKRRAGAAKKIVR